MNQVSRTLILTTICMGFTAGNGLCGSLSAAEKIDPANFQATVDNPYLPLVPGTIFTYSEEEKGDSRVNVVTVSQDTKMIVGVKCVVVHDTLTRNGALIEDTYDWYAQDKSGAVWYFGEDTKEFEGGRTITKGSWEAGKNGAEAGVAMPANPQPGEPYRQEYLKDEAEDMGQVAVLNETVKVPAGTYQGCVRIKEYSMLESGSAKKWYAKGVGFVQGESTSGEVVKLISVAGPVQK